MNIELIYNLKDDESIKAIMRAFSNLKAAVKTKGSKDLKKHMGSIPAKSRDIEALGDR